MRQPPTLRTCEAGAPLEERANGRQVALVGRQMERRQAAGGAAVDVAVVALAVGDERLAQQLPRLPGPRVQPRVVLQQRLNRLGPAVKRC